MESCSIENLGTRMIWANDGEEKIVFSQGLICEYSLMDNENSDYELLYLNDVSVAYIEKQDNSFYYWNTAEFRFLLRVPCDISREEIENMIESLTKYNE